jgi:hypothetical protein
LIDVFEPDLFQHPFDGCMRATDHGGNVVDRHAMPER